MKKYHFQENEKDFGSTVRLDAINDKVKEIKKKEETGGRKRISECV